MGQRIQVVAVEHKEGIGKLSKAPFSMDICQAIVHSDLPGVSMMVGEFVLPKDHPKVEPGFYSATMELARGADGKINPRITALSKSLAFAVPKAA